MGSSKARLELEAPNPEAGHLLLASSVHWRLFWGSVEHHRIHFTIWALRSCDSWQVFSLPCLGFFAKTIDSHDKN